MEHAEEVQWHEQYYWQQLESYHTTAKELKDRFAGQSQMVKSGMMSPLNPIYLGLQAVVRKIEQRDPKVWPWWMFWVKR